MDDWVKGTLIFYMTIPAISHKILKQVGLTGEKICFVQINIFLPDNSISTHVDVTCPLSPTLRVGISWCSSAVCLL